MAARPTPSGTYLLNLLGEGFVLSVFRAASSWPTHADREIFRRCMQDEARHVAYGTMELKSYLENHPDPEPAMDACTARRPRRVLVLTCIRRPLRPRAHAVLMRRPRRDRRGHGRRGLPVDHLREEYLQRCDRAGLDAAGRVQVRRLPREGSMLTFPSVEWFIRLGELMEENRTVHEHVGEIDCSCVWTVFDADGQGTDRHFQTTFELYSMTEA